MRIKTQIQPASFVPKRPDEFIGYAATVAKVFAAKAKAALTDRDAKLKYILTGNPGIGKTRLAEFLAEQLTGEHVTDGQSFSVESINGRIIDAAMIRGWREQCRYVPVNFTVKIINEIDTLRQDNEDALLSYFDEIPRKTAVIGTSNRKTSELTPRLQSRLQSFHIQPPTESEIKTLVSRWNIGKTNINNVLLGCGGNVRAALLDAQSILDAQLV
ncbi:MAG: AAA family ATPase [Verrucomicrobiota bacterium]